MNYEELLRAYLAGGGTDTLLEGGNGSQYYDYVPVELPDGRVVYRTIDQLAVMSNITPEGYNLNSFWADGTPAGGGYLSTPDLSAGRSLLRAGLTLGLPALGMNALGGMLSGAGTVPEGVAATAGAEAAGAIPTAAEVSMLAPAAAAAPVASEVAATAPAASTAATGAAVPAAAAAAAPGLMDIIRGAAPFISPALGAISADRAAQAQVDAARNSAQQVAEMTRFRPVNIRGGQTGADIQYDAAGNAVGFNQTLSPEMQGIQSGLLSGAQQYFKNPVTAEDYQKNLWANYEQMARPAQTNMFSQLQNTMAKQGLLGLQVNAPVAGGGTQRVNPMLSSFARGIGQADLNAYQNILQTGSNLASADINRGSSMLSSSMGIDREALNRISSMANLSKPISDQAIRAQLDANQAAAMATGNRYSMFSNLLDQILPRITGPAQTQSPVTQRPAPAANQTFAGIPYDMGQNPFATSPYNVTPSF